LVILLFLSIPKFLFTDQIMIFQIFPSVMIIRLFICWNSYYFPNFFVTTVLWVVNINIHFMYFSWCFFFICVRTPFCFVSFCRYYPLKSIHCESPYFSLTHCNRVVVAFLLNMLNTFIVCFYITIASNSFFFCFPTIFLRIYYIFCIFKWFFEKFRYDGQLAALDNNIECFY
jgi:hypothetical protein